MTRRVLLTTGVGVHVVKSLLTKLEAWGKGLTCTSGEICSVWSEAGLGAATLLLPSGDEGLGVKSIDWPILANGRLKLLSTLREKPWTGGNHRNGNILAGR